MDIMAKVELKGLRNAWLSPRGILKVNFKCSHGCSSDAFHHCIAVHILAEIEDFECNTYWRRKGNPTSDLEDLGWVRLCAFSPMCKPRWVLPIERRQTKKQTEIIASWLVENNLSADEAVDFV